MRNWYYYLHINGQLIGRNPIVIDSDPDYFNSKFVRKYWKVDLDDPEQVENIKKATR